MSYKEQLSIKSSAKRFISSVGFTLIELLISVSILTILSGAVISIINNSGLQSKARDSQRISDLKKIQVALELYFADNRKYPVSINTILITGSDSMSTALKAGYLSQVPSDPLAANTGVDPCSPNAGYTYTGAASNPIYILTAGMEVATSAVNAKGTCASYPLWFPSTCPTNCYGVVNP